MVANGEIKQPSINSKVYPSISYESLKGSLTGKVVIITGAAGGVGTGEAISFAKAGAKLALIDIPRARDRLSELVKRCHEESSGARGYTCDVTNQKESEETLKRIQEEVGPVDVLLNNAGGSNDRPFHMQDFDAFWSMIDLNLKAPLLWMHMLIPHFRARKHGTIINIASRSATVDGPFCMNYGAAKAGLVRAVGCLQYELNLDGFDDIDVYALHPGATKSGIQKPLPSDVAAVYPDIAKAYVEFAKLFPCEPALCGNTCVFLAAGRGKALKGRYFDCEQDIGYVASMGDTIKEQKLYELNVQFLGGLKNDGGTMSEDALKNIDPKMLEMFGLQKD